MIRLGVIGYGLRMQYFIGGSAGMGGNTGTGSSMKTAMPDLKVCAVLDPDVAGAKARLHEEDRDARFYTDFDEMMRKERLDAVAIGTRCHQHTPYAVKAAKYDVPLFLEKPVSISMEQAVELEHAFENSKCQVVVSFPLRFTTIQRKARQCIAERAVGEPQHIMAHNYVTYGMVYFEQEYRNYQITQGLFLQKATHDLDYMMDLMGSPVTRVAAMATRGHVFGGNKPSGLTCSKCGETETCPESPYRRKLSQIHTDNDHLCPFSVDCGSPKTGMNEDSSSCVMEFSTGAHGVYTQVFYARKEAGMRGATVSGYEGTLSFDWYKEQLRLMPHFQAGGGVFNFPAGTNHFGGDLTLALHFKDVIAGKAAPITSLANGLRSIYTCLAAKQSSERGTFVDVRQVGAVPKLAR